MTATEQRMNLKYDGRNENSEGTLETTLEEIFWKTQQKKQKAGETTNKHQRVNRRNQETQIATRSNLKENSKD